MAFDGSSWNPADQSEYPELIRMAAEHSGVEPDEIVAAIKLTLELLQGRPSQDERKAIYARWLEPVSGPLAEALDMPIETVHLALVGQVQAMDERPIAESVQKRVRDHGGKGRL
jgi:hypothetical protein